MKIGLLFFLQSIFFFIIHFNVTGQGSIATYFGSQGREGLFDAMELSDETILAVGYAEDLSWIPSAVTITFLDAPNDIPNGLGTNRYGLMLHMTQDLADLIHVVCFPQGVVEDIRFIKTNTMPYTITGDLYISCNTADTYDNDGGYILAKLNNNFVNGIPTALEWTKVVWAESYAKNTHPWDVTNDGRVYYVGGAAHGYDWSALYCLNEQGERMVVENWRTHWIQGGGEWKGTPASSFDNSESQLAYSGIALKVWNRCELRSWTMDDFQAILSDGNGGTKMGRWPADFLFSGPCDPNEPSADGPGYNGYSAEACCPVWGASSIVVDRSNNDMYLGMNFKSYSNPASSPDFEPAVIAFSDDGQMRWWSRLYHEITPQGDTVYSLPDQYVDAMAIDYQYSLLVVAARAHGNNTENLWEGNSIAANPNANGFQHQFTGSNGNIHESWIGKLSTSDGTLFHSTYVAEYAEGTGGFGDLLDDPNMDNWPDPNSGWPDVNTTYIAKNNMKVSSTGDVLIAGQGRRTMTTENAWQQMVLPQNGGQSCWNSFVRLYQNELSYPKYSSLVIGQWDTLTQVGGDNIRLFGVYKTKTGILAVGRHSSDDSNVSTGNDMPTQQVPLWGSSSAIGESGVLVYLKTDSLNSPTDGVNQVEVLTQAANKWHIAPNPSTDIFRVLSNDRSVLYSTYCIRDVLGRKIMTGEILPPFWNAREFEPGWYAMEIVVGPKVERSGFLVIH